MTHELLATATRSFAFGGFVLVPGRQALTKDGAPIRLGGRALDLLTVLVNRAGELVSKRELLARVWPDTVVEEGCLKVHMAALRRALGDVPAPAVYIATVSGRGYQFIAPVRAGEPPAAALVASTSRDRHHNLPVRHASILGRTEAIDLFFGELVDARLLSIVGASGVGKTTVALAVAEQALGSFQDGVWLVDLASLKGPDALPNAIAATLGLPWAGNDAATRLCESLRGKVLMLVLDNCDHLIDAAADWAHRILAATTCVKILATSREPLQIAGERVRRLPGLETPPLSSRPSAAQALCFPAVQLFLERAIASDERFEFGDTEALVVCDICRRLDGLALAIELAATRVGEFGVHGLLRRLHDPGPLLACRRAGPERHRSLQALFDWNCSRLPADETCVLHAVSVFEGEFGLDGAAAVADLSAAETSETLRRLAAKSLVLADFKAERARYRLLDTTRSACRERLRLHGEEDLVRGRHAQFLLQARLPARVPAPVRLALLSAH